MASAHYDVIIIGTGAGGAALAHRLAPSGSCFWNAVTFCRVNEKIGNRATSGARGAAGRATLFWDFLKNLSLAGGFLLITFGTDVGQVGALLSHPQLSSHPYSALP